MVARNASSPPSVWLVMFGIWRGPYRNWEAMLKYLKGEVFNACMKYLTIYVTQQEEGFIPTLPPSAEYQQRRWHICPPKYWKQYEVCLSQQVTKATISQQEDQRDDEREHFPEKVLHQNNRSVQFSNLAYESGRTFSVHPQRQLCKLAELVTT